MKTVDIRQVGAHLSRLIERVRRGEEIVIAEGGRPVARLVPIAPAGRQVKIGGLVPKDAVPDDFNVMFEDEIRALFYGGVTPPIHRKP